MNEDNELPKSIDGIQDGKLLEEYLQTLDSKTLKELWKKKRGDEKQSKRMQSQIMRNRYQSEQEFKDAIENVLRNCKSIKHAAEMMNVSTQTITKWAKIYHPDLFLAARNFGGKGIKHNTFWHQGKYPLNEILEGKHPEYSGRKLKERLLRHNIIPYECAVCHFNEAREIPGTRAVKPIILDYIDGNPKNHRAENLRFLCYNHYFILVGNIVGKHTKIAIMKKLTRKKYSDEEILRHLKQIEEIKNRKKKDGA